MSLVRVMGDVWMRSEVMMLHSSWNVMPFAQKPVVVGMLRQGCSECKTSATLSINTFVFAVMMNKS